MTRVTFDARCKRCILQNLWKGEDLVCIRVGEKSGCARMSNRVRMTSSSKSRKHYDVEVESKREFS